MCCQEDTQQDYNDAYRQNDPAENFSSHEKQHRNADYRGEHYHAVRNVKAPDVEHISAPVACNIYVLQYHEESTAQHEQSDKKAQQVISVAVRIVMTITDLPIELFKLFIAVRFSQKDLLLSYKKHIYSMVTSVFFGSLAVYLFKYTDYLLMSLFDIVNVDLLVVEF